MKHRPVETSINSVIPTTGRRPASRDPGKSRDRTWIPLAFLATAILSSTQLFAQTKTDESAAAPPPVRKLVEIYRIAPGKHEEFLRFVAFLDEINIKAGLPARDLYIHNDGDSWDFIIIQPAATPPDKSAALAKAWEESGAPSGADFFLKIREFIAEHTDSFATGPTTASDYLAGVSASE
jgi:hypothetical protein